MIEEIILTEDQRAIDWYIKEEGKEVVSLQIININGMLGAKLIRKEVLDSNK